MSHSSETNATHIGVSQGKSVGKGNSAEKLKEVFSQIVADRLIAEGLIEDVMDFYIFIDNFGPDMMSDLLTSLLKEKIVEYTLEQCNLYNIPLSSDEHDLKEAWSLKEQKWIPIKAKIVEYKGEPILLLPKKIMVTSYLYEPYQYLSKDILPRRKEELKIFLENAPLEEQQKYYDKKKGKTRKDQPSFEKIKEIEIKNIMSVKNYLIKQTKKDINLIKSFKQRVLNIMQGTSVNSNKLSDQKIEEIVKQTYERDKLKKK